MYRLLRTPLAAYAASVSLASASTLAGSDIAGPIVAPALAAEAPGVTTDFRGTLDALRALRAGKADAALVFLRNGETPPEVTSGAWRLARIAHQPVIVAVNRANAATEIDLATLAGLYGESTDTRYDTWRCLPESALTQGPFAIAPAPAAGIAGSYFQAEVLNGKPFRKTIRLAANADDGESRATTTVNAISLLPRLPKSGSLKVLAVADGRPGKSAKAYFPTASDIHAGDYPLSIPLCLIYPAAKRTEAATAVRAVLGENAAKHLRDKGMTPAPENLRKKFAQTLDN